MSPTSPPGATVAAATPLAVGPHVATSYAAGSVAAAVPPPPTITALTGLRAVAALWVVLFHYRGDVLLLVPQLGFLEPLMSAGYLGVDVFFVLSGFVLAYNYSGRLGSWAPRQTRDFVQNRVARVWPVHVVTLHLDLLQAAVIGTLGITAGGHRRTLSAYLQNLTMTHDWFSDRPSFNAPAWSISAEWAAYLVCPFLLLGLARIRRARTAAVLATLVYGAMLAVYAVWALPNGNVPHGGLLRVGGEFTAGLLLVRVHQSGPAWLARLALPWAVAVAALVLLVPASHGGDYWLAPAFGVLVLLLAQGSGALGRCLSTRWFVFGGEASYCLYMTHVLMRPALNALADPRDLAGGPLALRLLVLAGYAVALASAAVLLRRLVEVPARRALRARPSLRRRAAPAGAT